jgi:hypothetical protein
MGGRKVAHAHPDLEGSGPLLPFGFGSGWSG